MLDLKFHNSFVFRIPAFPFSGNVTSEKQLREIAKNEIFQEAIFIASPVLYNQMNVWLEGKLKDKKEISKIIFSLHKYYSRIYSRCTPYGLFAGCSTGQWGANNNITISSAIRRATRLDMNFACTLIHHLSKHPAIQPHLQFSPNTSIYPIGDRLRYVEYKYVNSKRDHSITSVDANEYLLAILTVAKKGAILTELEDALITKGIEKKEAKGFIEEVIESQLLVTELEPAVSGENLLQNLISFLTQLNEKCPQPEITKIVSIINQAEDILRKMDCRPVNEIKLYREVFEILQQLEIPLEEKNLFQVDSFYNTIEGEPSLSIINTSIQDKITAAIEFLTNLSSISGNKNLEDFKLRFYEKYENRELPLAEILDTETGIGYPTKDIHSLNFLVDDLHIPALSESSTLNWNNNDSNILRKLILAVKNGDYVVRFTDVKKNSSPEDLNTFAPSFSVMFKVIDSSLCKIEVINVGGGSSGANLLGRFAYDDEDIQRIIMDTTSFEQEAIHDKILAEIIHLPESRLGNILLRPVLRDYEIPYLAKSGVPIENQILLEELVVSIKKNRIILRSKRLNKEVIPRLSTAHNYSFNSLPVYKFLCDLQMQDIKRPSLSFTWGALASVFPFLPRVEYKDVVLFPATWNFSSTDFNDLILKINSDNFYPEVKIWKEKWKMPRYVVLKEGDNSLLIDFESELSLKTFFNEIKKDSSIKLSEFLFDPKNSLVKDEKGNSYTNEIIAVILNHGYKNTIATEFHKTSPNAIHVKRSFVLGSEWVYYKLYCGVKTADDILKDTIKPLIENFTKNELIEKWFFIRYSDPDIHIRLRFYNSDPAKLNEVMKLMNSSFQQMHEQGVVAKIMTDTYNRELERYGHNTMEISEHLFEIDSWATLNLLQITQGETADELKWQFAIRSLDSLMNGFGFDISRKLNLMEFLKTNFIAEHSTHKDLKVQLDTKFRKMRPQLNELFANDNFTSAGILNWNKLAIQPFIDQLLKLESEGELIVTLNDLISSYMHMSINRIFKSQQRKHEMVLYDQLYRYYKSKTAQEKSTFF